MNFVGFLILSSQYNRKNTNWTFISAIDMYPTIKIKPRRPLRLKVPESHNYMQDFIKSSSIHGVQYIEKPSHGLKEKYNDEFLKLRSVKLNFPFSNRIFWRILLLIAISSAISVGILVSKKFRNSPLATVFEDTNVPISHINFPATTICGHTRWEIPELKFTFKIKANWF